MPWGWYFTSALPRALHGAYLLAPLGAALDRRARPLFAVALGFVLLYSNLGHKEVGWAWAFWHVGGELLPQGRCGRRLPPVRSAAGAGSGTGSSHPRESWQRLSRALVCVGVVSCPRNAAGGQWAATALSGLPQ